MLSETPSPGAGQSTPARPSAGQSLQRFSRIGRGKTSQDKLTWASRADDQIPSSVGFKQRVRMLLAGQSKKDSTNVQELPINVRTACNCVVSGGSQ